MGASQIHNNVFILKNIKTIDVSYSNTFLKDNCFSLERL